MHLSHINSIFSSTIQYFYLGSSTYSTVPATGVRTRNDYIFKGYPCITDACYIFTKNAILKYATTEMKAQFRSELSNLTTPLLHPTVKLLHRWQRVQNLFTFICRYANGALGNHRWFRIQFIVRSIITDKDYSHGYHRSLHIQNWSQNSTPRLYGNNSNNEKKTRS